MGNPLNDIKALIDEIRAEEREKGRQDAFREMRGVLATAAGTSTRPTAPAASSKPKKTVRRGRKKVSPQKKFWDSMDPEQRREFVMNAQQKRLQTMKRNKRKKTRGK